MKGAVKILVRPVKVTTGYDKLDHMLLGKELLEWVHCTRKLSAKMGNAYNFILGNYTASSGSKLEILKGWEETSDNSDLISLMNFIKGLIVKHYDAK